MELVSTEGFTLVELLASLSVLALLSLLILAGVGDRSIAWTRIDKDTANGEAVEAIQMLLHDRIQHIWPVTVYYIRPAGPDFDGEGTSMDFFAASPAAMGSAPLRRYHLALETGGDLVLDSRSDVAIDQDHWANRQVLLHGVQAMDLSYFGPSRQDQSPDWRLQWSERSILPSLVRIRVDFPAGDRRRWPDLIVHPMADIDASCQLVVASGRCRGR